MSTSASASAPELTVQELHDLEDMESVENLFRLIWQSGDQPMVGSEILRALAHAGGYVVGAFEEGGLVGGLVGFIGLEEDHGLSLHSHIMGVLPTAWAHGIGFTLKQHQRRWALEREIETITWTFDPLLRRNAYFNIAKLGAGVAAYHVNYYGDMTDGINGGDESDRIMISWKLHSPRAEAAAAGAVEEPDIDGLRAANAALGLTEGPDGEPLSGPIDGDVLLFQIPAEMIAVRRQSPELAMAWRLALRRAMVEALESGYSVQGFSRAGWYVLRRHA